MRNGYALGPSPTAAIAAIVFLFVAGPAFAQRRAIDPQHSTITIHVFKAGLFRAFADNHLIQANPADGFVDDSPSGGVDLVVDAQRLRVLDPGLSPKDREQVQARMLGPEVLDATRFPRIRFRSRAVQRIDADHWLVRGDLDLHGQTREVAVTVAREKGRYTGRVPLRQRDFGITPVSVAGGTVKVKDELSVEFDIATADH